MDCQYKKQLQKIEWEDDRVKDYQHSLQKAIDKKKELEYKLYGSPDSPFYGLKYPSQTKIINYIGDKYNVCGDLLEKIQKILVKKDMDKTINYYECSALYNRINPDYKGWHCWQALLSETEYTKFSDTHIPRRKLDERYWFGGLASSSFKGVCDSINGNRSILKNCVKHRLTTVNKHKYDKSMLYKLTKAELIKILNDCDIKYKSSMNKNELYNLVVSKSYRKDYQSNRNSVYVN